jgi:hypothetical protein
MEPVPVAVWCKARIEMWQDTNVSEDLVASIFRVKIQVSVFWVMTPYSDVLGYHRFRGPCCLHLQGEDLSLSLLGYNTV